MKAIFLTENPRNIDSVYSKEVTYKLCSLCSLDTEVYSKVDILSKPSVFENTEVIFSTWGMPSFTKEEIREYFPSLKCVFYAAGSVQSFARPFLECGVKVFSAWAANAVPVAEYTVAQIILANKGFFALSRLMANGKDKEARRQKNDYFGNYREKIGIIGCGMIGSLVANMLKQYDFEVYAYDPFLSKERADMLSVKLTTLDGLFSNCRVVTNHLANNEQTKGMLNYGYFSKMLPYSTFINTGRGAQVVEPDLVKALTERQDITALLDVTYPEPCEPSHPFYSLKNCVMTPHIAGSSGGEVVRMAEYMADELEAYIGNKETKYEVSLKMLETMA